MTQEDPKSPLPPSNQNSKRFSTSNKILSAFESDEETNHLLSWFQADFQFLLLQGKGSGSEPQSLKRNHHPTNSNGSNAHRVGAAFCILNAIRDGAQEFLKKGGQQSFVASSSADPSPQIPGNTHTASTPFQGEDGYTDAFPSLTSSTASGAVKVLKGRKKPKKKKSTGTSNTSITSTKSLANPRNRTNVPNIQHSISSTSGGVTKSPKRRIRPTTLAEKVPSTHSVWGSSSSSLNSPKDATNATNFTSLTANWITGGQSNAKDPWANSFKESNTPTDPMARIMDRKQNDIASTSSWQSPSGKEANDISFGVARKGKRVTLTPHESRTHPGNNNGTVISKETSDEKITSCEELSQEKGEETRRKQQQKVETTENQVDPDPQESERLHLICMRVSKVYCALIINQIVPSIGLELQLMLRLLSFDDDQPCRVNENLKMECAGHSLGKVFGRADLCQRFAIDVLDKLRHVIRKFGNDILVPLLKLKCLTDRIPSLVEDIRSTLDSRLTQPNSFLLESVENVSSGGGSGLGTSGKSAIMTIPFQERRDSRHNYRTKELSTMFNNREESRGTECQISCICLPRLSLNARCRTFESIDR